MIQIGIVTIALTILILMSVRANRQYALKQRLPMQWSMSGSVTWTAPRKLALAFTPLLAGISLVGAAVATLTIGPRPGQEGLEVPVMAILGIGFVTAHALHLWLIEKAIKANGN